MVTIAVWPTCAPETEKTTCEHRPFGMTGARIMTTLLNVMETDDHSVGLETMCVAGGQGEAMIVERLN
jgi:acetyl-CoA acetyltransferase